MKQDQEQARGLSHESPRRPMSAARRACAGCWLVCVGWLVLACSPGAARPHPQTTDTCGGPRSSYRSDVAPLVKRYCLRCHAPGGDAGDDHDFTRFDVLHAQRKSVFAELEAHGMPPRGLPQPSAEERARLMSWACLGAPNN